MRVIRITIICLFAIAILFHCHLVAYGAPIIGYVMEPIPNTEAYGVTKEEYKFQQGVEAALVVIEGANLEARSNILGWFYFGDLPDGVYNIAVVKEGYYPVTKQVKVEGRAPATITIVLNRKQTPKGITGNYSSPKVTIPNEVYVAFAAIAAPGSSSSTPGSTPGVGNNMTTLSYKMALAAGGDPDKLTGFPSPQMPQDGFGPQSASEFITNPNYYPNSLTILDPNTPQDQKYVNLNQKPYWLCFDSTGSMLYVSTDGKNICVIDIKQNNKVIGSLPTGGIVTDMTRGPDGNIYVTIMSASPSVLVISPSTNTVLSYFKVKAAHLGNDAQPRGVAAGTNFIYVTMATSSGGEVIAVNKYGGAAAGSCPVGSYPQGIALTPNGQFLFVANFNEGTLSVVRTADMAHLGKIRVGIQPIRVICNSRGDRVYVTNQGSNYVSVINAANGAIVSTVSTGSRPMGIGINSSGTRVFVANNGDGTITIINAETNSNIQTTTASTTSRPFGIAVRP